MKLRLGFALLLAACGSSFTDAPVASDAGPTGNEEPGEGGAPLAMPDATVGAEPGDSGDGTLPDDASEVDGGSDASSGFGWGTETLKGGTFGGIAILDDDLYIAVGTQIVSCALPDCAQPKPLVTEASAITSLVAGAGRLGWVLQASNVVRVRDLSTNLRTFTMTSDTFARLALTADSDGDVAVVVRGVATTSSDMEQDIYQPAEVDGGTPGTTLASNIRNGNADIAANDVYLYASQPSGTSNQFNLRGETRSMNHWSAGGGVDYCPSATCKTLLGITTFGTSNTVYGATLDVNNVETIERVANGVSTVVVTNRTGVLELQSGPAGVVWVEGAGHDHLVGCSDADASCTVTALGTAPGAIVSIAMTSQFIYAETTGSSPTIARFNKP